MTPLWSILNPLHVGASRDYCQQTGDIKPMSVQCLADVVFYHVILYLLNIKGDCLANIALTVDALSTIL